jgi:hypothetical protein
MSRSRTRPVAPARLPRRPLAGPPDGPGVDFVLAAAAVVAACVVFRGTLGYFFAQDDFTGLARARGLAPPVAFPWRWLSGQFYFDVMRAIAGLEPMAYRAASLAAHAACVALVYRWCRRFSAPPAAALGAVFFGTHPALYTALYSVSGIGEILAAGCGLGALLLATRADRAAWLALPLFAASLLSKESTLLLPLVALLPALRTRRDATPAGRPAVAWAMVALSLAYLGAFLVRDVFGVRTRLDAAAPYALRFDRTLVDNLLTYLGWSVRIALPSVRSFSDAVDPGVFADGAVFAAVVLGGLALRDLRARGWGVGAALFAATLLPLLPLVHHTYHYYLYAPLAGAAVLVAALASAAMARLARIAGRALPVALLATAALALAVNGALLVHRIETYPFVDPELRSDPTVDRARIAANAIADLRAAGVPRGTRLWFWSPVSLARQREAGGNPAVESYWESNVRGALYDGLAARVFLPQVDSTRFVRRFEPAADPVRYAVYLPNGHLRVGAPAQLDSLMRAAAARATP